MSATQGDLAFALANTAVLKTASGGDFLRLSLLGYALSYVADRSTKGKISESQQRLTGRHKTYKVAIIYNIRVEI
ncbi:MAG: hypothetical protein ACJAX1_001110 [Neolewinella sp.]|jgi:hypothetical protein